MRKGFQNYGIVWLLAVVLFNVIAFAIPSTVMINKFEASYWVGYVFVMVAFIGQAICSYIFFEDSDNPNKVFLNLPIITISYSALTVSTIAGILCMIIPFIPVWFSAIVCMFIFVIYMAAIAKAKTSGEIVSEIDNKVKEKTLFIKSLTIDLETLEMKAKNADIKKEVSKIKDVCRYSDPMSSSALNGVESQITMRFSALETAVENNDCFTVKNICEEMNVLLADRNKKCKLLK